MNLFDWLNETHNNNSEHEIGLLLAPLSVEHNEESQIMQVPSYFDDENFSAPEPPDIAAEIPDIEHEILTPKLEHGAENISEDHTLETASDPEPEILTPTLEHWADDTENIPEDYTLPEDTALTPAPDYGIYTPEDDTGLTLEPKPDYGTLTTGKHDPDYGIYAPEDDTSLTLETTPEHADTSEDYGTHELPEGYDNETASRNTGFMLNLDEPPPEIWTRINNPTEDDDEEEEQEYEQGMSLQGDAYVLKQSTHGLNFTQRLQRTLQGRKQRAAQRREEEAQHNPHPYRSKALIMCGTMLIALILSWVCLLFLQKGVAGYIERAHTQTQAPEPEQKPEPESEQKPEPVIIPAPAKPKPQEKPAEDTASLLTFDEALTEGNHSYNIGMYSRAVIHFHRALALRDDDIRPYIGLAASYRAKGMFFDAKRILDEARIKFGRNPAIEMEQYYLRRE